MLIIIIIISVKFQRLPNKRVSVAPCKAVGEELKQDECCESSLPGNSRMGGEELEVPGLRNPGSQRSWTPGGEGSWLQGGSTGSRRGYKALAIKFELRIRHTLPQTGSRHRLLIFRLEKPFLTDTGGGAGARRAPAEPAAPCPPVPKGAVPTTLRALSVISLHFHGGKG